MLVTCEGPDLSVQLVISTAPCGRQSRAGDRQHLLRDVGEPDRDRLVEALAVERHLLAARGGALAGPDRGDDHLAAVLERRRGDREAAVLRFFTRMSASRFGVGCAHPSEEQLVAGERTTTRVRDTDRTVASAPSKAASLLRRRTSPGPAPRSRRR